MRLIQKILLSILLLVFPAAIANAATISSQTCPGTGCIDYNTNGSNSGSIQLVASGDWSGTITFQASVDGTNFVTFVVRASTQTTITTAVGTSTSGGVFLIDRLSGIKIIRINCTSFSAGTMTVTASFSR